MKKFVIALVVVAILVAAWVLWPKSGMTVTIPARPTVTLPTMQAGEINLIWWATIQTGVIMLLLFVGVAVRPASFKFNQGEALVTTSKRITGAIVTLCVIGMIWFAISSRVIALVKHAIEDGRIQISAYNKDTLIVPADATIAGERHAEPRKIGLLSPSESWVLFCFGGFHFLPESEEKYERKNYIRSLYICRTCCGHF